jgi:hypothetical protein
MDDVVSGLSLSVYSYLIVYSHLAVGESKLCHALLARLATLLVDLVAWLADAVSEHLRKIAVLVNYAIVAVYNRNVARNLLEELFVQFLTNLR